MLERALTLHAATEKGIAGTIKDLLVSRGIIPKRLAYVVRSQWAGGEITYEVMERLQSGDPGSDLEHAYVKKLPEGQYSVQLSMDEQQAGLIYDALTNKFGRYHFGMIIGKFLARKNL